MAFSFGFSGDDIDVDIGELEIDQPAQENPISGPDENDSLPKLVEAKRHEMGDWIPTLPSQISYNNLRLNAVKAGDDEESIITLARREVFDIRAQLMAEDSAEQENNDELISGLEHGDIKPNFYEGGFKTWECALDLAKLVVGDAGTDMDGDGDCHIIELGAGTAIPSLALFAQLLSQPEMSTQPRRTHFTFADYNAPVLRLVTLPNIILTWNHLISRQKRSDIPSSEPRDQEDQDPDQEEENEEELDITPELLENFQQDLTKRGITIDFISGAWSSAFVDLAFSSSTKGEETKSSRTLILASETIYSPSSLGVFSETLLALLRRSATTDANKSRALVAAKKVYFGVGGGVDEFVAVLKDASGHEVDVQQVDVKSEGVGRVILEVAQPASLRT